MKLCKNCGAELVDSAAFCRKCGAKLSSDEASPLKPPELAEEVSDEITSFKPATLVADIHEEVSEVSDASDDSETSAKDSDDSKSDDASEETPSKFASAKENLVKRSKSAIAQILVTRVITALLTIALSVITTLFVQNSFEDDFYEYYSDVLKPASSDIAIIADFADDALELSPREIIARYENDEIHNKMVDLMKLAGSFSSKNEDIMKIHNLYVDFCNEAFVLSSTIYSIASTQVEDGASHLDGYMLAEYHATEERLSVKVAILLDEVKIMKEKYDIGE